MESIGQPGNLSKMKVVRSFKSHPLRSARDLRELRTQLRVAGNELQADPRGQFEFICACTAVARTLLDRRGEGLFNLDIVHGNSHKGLRATFWKSVATPANHESATEIEQAMKGMSYHGFDNMNRLVDGLDIGQQDKGHVVASLLKWVS